MMGVDLGPISDGDRKTVLEALPLLDELPNGTAAASSSLTLPTRPRHRLLLQRDCVVIDRIIDTQPPFTRCWIDPMGKRKCRPSQRDAVMATLQAGALVPTYVKPLGESDYQDYCSIDLRRAYLSIFRRVCWDIEYLRGGPNERYFGPGTGKHFLGDYPFDPSFKVIYSYVITGSLPYSRTMLVYNGTLKPKTWPNERSNPQLVSFVSDVLHAIAWYFVNAFQARRVHTDGYIIPAKFESEAIHFLASLGLESKPVQHRGLTRISHLNSYSVGDKQTKRTSLVVSQPMDKILLDGEQTEWLLNHFMRLA